MTDADAKLHRLLGGEPVAWLVRRARDRLESRASADRYGYLTRRHPGAAARG